MRVVLSRRDFLERAACAGALLAAARPAAAAGGMYVSLNGSLIQQKPPLSWPDFVGLAGRLGYGGVDVNLAAARTAGVDATRALLAEAKVKPAVANLPMQFAAADEAAFQEGLKQLDESAKFAAAIGLGRMMAVMSPSSQTPKEARRKFVKDRVAAIADVLQRSNIRLGLEFLGPLYFRTRAPYPFIWKLDETVALAQECGANIGVVLDAWHWHHSGGTTAEIIAAGKARIVHVHASDAKPQPPEEVRDNQRFMPGEGVIDLVGFFQALRKIGYEDGVSPEPLGRVPADMAAEEAARLGLETTLAVMKKAGIIPASRAATGDRSARR
jgi:sugar phosphate isomerase/epimerase